MRAFILLAALAALLLAPPASARSKKKAKKAKSKITKVAQIKASVISLRRAVSSDGKLFFFNTFGRSSGHRILRTDGTTKGTFWVSPKVDGFQDIATSGQHTFFANASQLWVTRGDAKSTRLVFDFAASTKKRPIIYLASTGGGTVCFTGHDDQHGFELWCSDGTNGGTRRVTSLYPKQKYKKPRYLTSINDKAYFCAPGGKFGVGKGLFEVTGSKARLALDMKYCNGLHIAGGAAYVWGVAQQNARQSLYRRDPTSGKFTWLKGEGENLRRPQELVTAGKHTYFQAAPFDTGLEPWVTDGTAAGTKAITDLNPGKRGQLGGNFRGAMPIGDKLYFNGRDATTAGVYVSDGTAGGTKKIGGKACYYGTVYKGAGYCHAKGEKSYGRVLTRVTAGGLQQVKGAPDVKAKVASFVRDGALFYLAETGNGVTLYRYKP